MAAAAARINAGQCWDQPQRASRLVAKGTPGETERFLVPMQAWRMTLGEAFRLGACWSRGDGINAPESVVAMRIRHQCTSWPDGGMPLGAILLGSGGPFRPTRYRPLPPERIDRRRHPAPDRADAAVPRGFLHRTAVVPHRACRFTRHWGGQGRQGDQAAGLAAAALAEARLGQACLVDRSPAMAG